MEEHIRKYHPLGKLTLLVLILRRSFVLVVLVPMLLFGLVALYYVPSQYIDFFAGGLFGYLLLVIIMATVAIGMGWLEYLRYGIFVDDKNLKVARGLIATEQIGIPYRRIKDIKISRSLVDQLFGVSDIIITTLGTDENDLHQEEPATILPALEEKIAIEIQDMVLRKAQVEQINVVDGRQFGR